MNMVKRDEEHEPRGICCTSTKKSSGFSRGASLYRGMTRHHQHGRWQARIARGAGNKDLYLGTFGTQEKVAEAYDIAAIKCPRTPPTSNPTMDYQTADSEHILKRSRPWGITDEANNLPVNMLPVAYPNQSHGQSSYSSDDLPRSVVMTLRPGSTVKSGFPPSATNFTSCWNKHGRCHGI